MEKQFDLKTEASTETRWIKLCLRGDLVAETGMAALVNHHQIALFYLPSQNHQVFALDNWDPLGEAFVLSRGIIGDQNGVLCVASPLHKQHYALETGECLEYPEKSVSAWKTEWRGDELWVLS